MKKSVCAVLFTALLFGMLFTGCGEQEVSTNQTEITLYFANAQKNELKPEKRMVSASGNLLETAINELLKGPVDTTLLPVIPTGTKLLDVSLKDGVASVNLSTEYMSQDGASELLARYSIANTLFEIEGVKKTSFLVDGVELKDTAGEPVGEISKNSVVTTPADNTPKNVYITLYFPDEAAIYLEPEKRLVPIVDNSVEKTVITELMKGPQNATHQATIPAEAKLISVETKDGICFVNFSNEFITKHSGGSTGEMMTIYSIVSSLTALDNIDKVQFLIDGNKVPVFQHMIFNEPFSRDDSLIKE